MTNSAVIIGRGPVHVIALHGWFVDIHAGQMLALNGETGRFEAVNGGRPVPVAQPAAQRLAADFLTEAAE